MNLYGYVLNDPVNTIDASGLSSCDINSASDLIQEKYPDLNQNFVIEFYKLPDGQKNSKVPPAHE